MVLVRNTKDPQKRKIHKSVVETREDRTDDPGKQLQFSFGRKKGY